MKVYLFYLNVFVFYLRDQRKLIQIKIILYAARKNNHTFENEAEEARKLIYNYPVTYTALKNSSFVQCYLFKSSDTT